MSPTSNAVPFIPAFAAMVSPLGRVNELSIQLILIGIFTISIYAALPPTNLSSSYPNSGNYHLEQPPLRDHVLVFGIASLTLVVLISRICRLSEPQTTSPLSFSSTVRAFFSPIDIHTRNLADGSVGFVNGPSYST
ncbi:hypothetical protein BJ322DRAFT_828980 [Thelephora terrestris]|uniref:Uncharacterized protein n=1 Tax=Thelephora terrestris TaxID=56493 RepID=A0A9P6HF23_9AGAM|nr:hypothetical protein BJ322DRAFT_828980 [Thelephora terrestris]